MKNIISAILKAVKNAKRLFFFTLISLAISWVISWQASYFVVLSAIFLFILLIFWKTEECFLFLIFYLPFQVALNITGEIDLASVRLFIIVLFCAWLAKSLANKKINIPYNPISLFLFVFLALAILSAFFSIDQEKSFVRSLFFLSIFPLYFISAFYLNSILKITRAFQILLASAAAAAFAGILQFFGQFAFGIDGVMNFWIKNIAYLFYGQSFGKAVIADPSWLVNIGGETYFRAISFFPDPHMFAFYLGLVIPVSFSLILFANELNFSFRQKILLLACNIILFSALGFTFSRAGYLAAILGLGSVFVFSREFLRGRIKILISALALVVAIAAFSVPNSLVSRFYDIFNFSEGSNSQRLLNWRQAIKIIEDYPITGVGIGTYAEALNARAPLRSSVTAHNTYLDIAAEMGVFAVLVWIIIIIATIKKLVFLLKFEKRRISLIKVFLLGLAGSFAWFFVQMFFDTAIYSPALLAIVMIYLAIAVNLEKESQRLNS